MKAILVININDDLLEDYENFYVDYDLRAERKDENVNESIKYVEDCPLRLVTENNTYAVIVNNEVVFIEPPKIDESFMAEVLGDTHE